jgi:hypothetical protein
MSTGGSPQNKRPTRAADPPIEIVDRFLSDSESATIRIFGPKARGRL